MAGEAAVLLRSARPALLVGGRESSALEGGLIDLAIHESVEGLYRCEALFNNWGATAGGTGYLYFDRRILEFGKRFEVRLAGDTLFDGRIMALQAEFPEGAPPRVRVLAEDRLQDLRMTRRTRSFADASDADVVSQIARDHGLTPRTDISGPVHKVLAQVNQSDLAFIRERARAVGAEVWVDDTTLGVAPRAQRRRSGLRLVHGAKLREFAVVADLAGQCTELAYGGWDVAAKAAVKGAADATILRGELGTDESGAAVLRAAVGDRAQTIAHGVPHNAVEARARAESHFRALARRFVVGRGVAEPDARLRVGASVELQGLGPLFNGTYYVSETHTLFDGANGLRTAFAGERPGLGRP
ncbi:MAG TPA: contractile injection system protein, VgrG/Pvc8 family [bacterium]